MTSRVGGSARSALLLIVVVAAAAATPGKKIPDESTDSSEVRRPSNQISVVATASYMGDALGVVRGGESHGAALLHMGRVAFDVEVSSTFQGHVSLIGNAGSGINPIVGDIQGPSNIEAPTSWRVFEAWVDQGLLDGKGSILLGLYDLNGEFYVTESAELFLNSSHGIGPEFGLTGRGGPSIFPFTALAVRLGITPWEGVTWRSVVLDGVPGQPGSPEAMGVSLSREDGALLASEVEVVRGVAGDFRVVVGGWAYTSDFEHLDPDLIGSAGTPRNHGFYAVAEGALTECGGRTPCVRAFLRAGSAEPRYNVVGRAWGAGVVLSLPQSGVEFGTALAGASAGEHYLGACRRDGLEMLAGELNLELTARLPLTDRLRVIPDLQYVFGPGMSSSLPNALVAGARFEISF